MTLSKRKPQAHGYRHRQQTLCGRGQESRDKETRTRPPLQGALIECYRTGKAIGTDTHRPCWGQSKGILVTSCPVLIAVAAEPLESV